MHNDNCYLIIPASGSGSRMNAEIPKQYLKLENGLTIVDQCLKTLLEIDRFLDALLRLLKAMNDLKIHPITNIQKYLDLH